MPDLPDHAIRDLLACADGEAALLELVNAASAFVGFSFAEEKQEAEAEGRAVSSVPFVRVEQRLRRAVRAVTDLLDD